ncbi:hypothetical protein ACJJTC_018264 [Scirpophaga incertulas]
MSNQSAVNQGNYHFIVILEQIIPQLHNQGYVLTELAGQKKRDKLILLFGTLDSEDAKKYDEEIEKLNQNEHDTGLRPSVREKNLIGGKICGKANSTRNVVGEVKVGGQVK